MCHPIPIPIPSLSAEPDRLESEAVASRIGQG